MGEPYSIQPQATTPISTRWRSIQSPIPHPDSVALLEQLRAGEPVCMEGQPPVVWDRAAGASVWDAWGNRWIDLTSGVLIANAGHGRPEIAAAITEAAARPLLTTYCFPHHYRAELTALLRSLAPRPDDKVMLLSTGSEADELCLKLCREQARRRSVRDAVFVSFTNAFHGRTLGSQRAGGIPSLQEWIGYPDPHFLTVPFPDGGVRSRPEDNDFAAFERTLAAHNVAPERVCGVISETYQGGNSSFAPPAYMQALRAWCDRHGVPLIMDEVQAGFGRTGTFWGYEHYNIIPDLISCGKGISGGLPLSAVIGRRDLLDQFPPGSMTSTHSGNTVCCAAALANIRLILNEQLTRRAATLGAVMQERAAAIQHRFSRVILAHHGKGLVASLHCVRPGTTEPDPHLAWQVIGEAVRAGVMLFAPVGFGGASVKLCPPLTIPEDALREALDALETVFANVVHG
jgi:4-aminobutyrate aminotransferase-like enzyme